MRQRFAAGAVSDALTSAIDHVVVLQTGNGVVHDVAEYLRVQRAPAAGDATVSGAPTMQERGFYRAVIDLLQVDTGGGSPWSLEGASLPAESGTGSSGPARGGDGWAAAPPHRAWRHRLMAGVPELPTPPRFHYNSTELNSRGLYHVQYSALCQRRPSPGSDLNGPGGPGSTSESPVLWHYHRRLEGGARVSTQGWNEGREDGGGVDDHSQGHPFDDVPHTIDTTHVVDHEAGTLLSVTATGSANPPRYRGPAPGASSTWRRPRRASWVGVEDDTLDPRSSKEGGSGASSGGVHMEGDQGFVTSSVKESSSLRLLSVAPPSTHDQEEPVAGATDSQHRTCSFDAL